MKLTLEQLPEAVSQLHEKLDNIQRLLLRIETEIAGKEQKASVMNIKQAAAFLGLAVSTVQTMVSRAEIPSYKAGKRLYFIEDELRDWIKTGRRKTAKELQTEADNYQKRKRV